MKNKYLWWAVIPIWGVAAWVTLASEMPLTWRFTVVFGFLLVCPGKAYIQFLPVSDKLAQIPLIIALSILLGSIVALAMIYTKIWEPQAGFMVLVGLSIMGIIFQILSETRKLSLR